MKFPIILVAVLAVIAYDYFHDKTIIKKPGAWIKYVVGVGSGLLVAIIPAWAIPAGAVVVGCIFWGVISNFVIALYNKVTKKTPTTAVGKV